MQKRINVFHSQNTDVVKTVKLFMKMKKVNGVLKITNGVVLRILALTVNL